MAMLTMRARRFLNKTGRKINANGSETIWFNKSKVEYYNCHKRGHFVRKYRAARENRIKEPVRRNVTMETTKTKALVAQDELGNKFKTGVGYDSQVVDSQVFDSLVNDEYKTGERYHAVPPPYTGNFMPLKPNLVLADEEEYVFSELITSVLDVATSKVETSESKPKSVSEPLIEDWISNSEDENETEFKSKQRKPSFAKVEFVKYNEHVKIPRESVEKGNPQMDLKDQGVIDSRCSRHMTGSMSYIIDYEEIDRRYVAFGGNPKGWKITRKARTPQQNKVAERRNRTLIKAARTMLADSKLPTTF
ncbi:hypothetical protein Tco_0140676 [Tanacetum coccineum]